MAVAAVDDNISLFKMREQLLDEIVHGGPRLHEHHDLARVFQVARQFLNAVAADNRLALGATRDECVHLFHGAVVAGDGEPLARHVENNILAHDGETDETDVSLLWHKFSPVWEC